MPTNHNSLQSGISSESMLLTSNGMIVPAAFYTKDELIIPAFIEERKIGAKPSVIGEDPGKQDEQFVKAQTVVRTEDGLFDPAFIEERKAAAVTLVTREGSCELGETVEKPVAASPQIKPPSSPAEAPPFAEVSCRKTFINSSLPIPRETQSKETHKSQYDLAKLLLCRVFLKSHEGTLYLFDGTIYRMLTEDKAKMIILKHLEDEISKQGHSSVLPGVLAFLKAEPSIVDTPISEPRWVCFRNGILDMERSVSNPHSSRYFVTSYLEADYIPGFCECPKFDAFLWTVSGGDSELVQRIWQAIGYILIPDNSGKRFLFMLGIGNSGKSVVGNLLSAMFNEEAVSNVDIFKLGERFASVTLKDKRLNISMDLPKGKIGYQAASLIKMLTGNDTIAVESKYRDMQSYSGGCKLVFASNHPITLHESDEAFCDRVLLLPFEYAIPKSSQNPNLLKELLWEKSAIATKAVAAYQGLRANNYIFAGDDRFCYRKQGEGLVTNQQGLIETFIGERCDFEAGCFTPTHILFDAYTQFCFEQGCSCVTNANSFSKAFGTVCGNAVALTKSRAYDGTAQGGYLGIKLL